MQKGERKFIYIVLTVIIICSGILIYKINSTPKYDPVLYEQVYSAYEDMLLEIDNKQANIAVQQTGDKKDDRIYIFANSQEQKYRIAGEISIPKIGISYPIIYETSDEYLKIAPAKLFGPGINEVGNVCIVGHNYKNNQFFSKLSDLEVNDKVYLMTNEGESLAYLVYKKYEVLETDLECTSQNTNGNIEATLITCTANKKNRLVVKCRAVN